MRALDVLLPTCLLLALPAPGAAAELGLRVSALHADQRLQGAGFAVRLPQRARFFVDLSVERQQGLQGPGVTVLGAALGRSTPTRHPDLATYWSWGIAAGLPSRDSSGRGTTRVAAGTAIHLALATGLRYRVHPRWALDVSLRAERHYLDRHATDGDGRTLERRRRLEPIGAALSLSYRF